MNQILPPPERPMIVIEDLHVTYGGAEALCGIDLEIHKNEKAVIIGPSGSGKSTLLKSLLYLVKPSKGRIFIEGSELTEKTASLVRQELALVFQSYTLFPHMTVLRNVAFPIEKVKKAPRDQAEDMARETLDSVGLTDKISRYPLELSGGQRQRAAIARALALKPKILLLDEPTSALDPEFAGEVLDILKEIARTGMTMLIVTHEMDFAEDVATIVVFMEDGKIMEVGSKEDMLHHPSNQRLRKFLERIIKRKEIT